MNTKNRLLSALPGDELKATLPHLARVQLPLKQLLHESSEPIEYLYFVESGMASMVIKTEAGNLVEVASIGAEGVVGFPAISPIGPASFCALVVVTGDALRIKASDLRGLLPQTPHLRRLLLGYSMTVFNRVAQSSLCDRLHEMTERFARWLLLTNDCVGQDTFPLTQETIAEMMGVYRPRISNVASKLQKAGLIRYNYGRITIANRQKLEEASCSCYRAIADEYDRLLTAASPAAR